MFPLTLGLLAVAPYVQPDILTLGLIFALLTVKLVFPVVKVL